MPKISPDERWMAYVSDESGRPEVYVTAFPVPAGKVQISRNGGEGPVWSVDGQGLYYLTPEDEFVAVRLRTEGSIAVMTREVLFDARGWQTFFLNAEYDVHPDGGRFVFIAATESEREPGITVVVNWFKELKELMGN